MSSPAHVVLVGMMGVGKSTVGSLVATALGVAFVDSDAEVERRTGRTVAELFAAGEPEFRAVEAAVMAELLDSDAPNVIAAAGGAVLDPDTRRALRDRSTVVWLQAPVDVLVGRVTGSDHRPALADDARGTLERMRNDREALYVEVADLTIDSSVPVDEVAAAIVDAVVASRGVVA